MDGDDGKPVREEDLLSDDDDDDTQPKICPYKNLLFHVYRLDPNEKKWVEMESLGGSGSTSIVCWWKPFHHSISLWVEDFPRCIRPCLVHENF